MKKIFWFIFFLYLQVWKYSNLFMGKNFRLRYFFQFPKTIWLVEIKHCPANLIFSSLAKAPLIKVKSFYKVLKRFVNCFWIIHYLENGLENIISCFIWFFLRDYTRLHFQVHKTTKFTPNKICYQIVSQMVVSQIVLKGNLLKLFQSFKRLGRDCFYRNKAPLT